jgi:hypothetical protein
MIVVWSAWQILELNLDQNIQEQNIQIYSFFRKLVHYFLIQLSQISNCLIIKKPKFSENISLNIKL